MSKLKEKLRALGSAGLFNLIGEGLRLVADLSPESLTEGGMADILIELKGTAILSDKKVRVAIIDSLSSDEISSIAKLLPVDVCQKYQDGLAESMKVAFWRAESPLPTALTTFLELDERYLPTLIPEQAPAICEASPQETLHDYQRQIKNQLVSSLLEGEEKVLVHMPTGAGKTRTTMEGLSEFLRQRGQSGKSIIWLADTRELCDQAADAFEECWRRLGDRTINVVRLRSKKDEKESEVAIENSECFIVMGIQKGHSLLTSAQKDQAIFMNKLRVSCRVLVMDEAHKAIAPTYKHTISSLLVGQGKSLVGLTATPGRSSDEEIMQLAKFFDHNKLTISLPSSAEAENLTEYLQKRGILSFIESAEPIPGTSSLDDEAQIALNKAIREQLDVPQIVLERLSQDSIRNAAIIARVVQYIRQEKTIIIFACSVVHAEILTVTLLSKKERVGCVLGSSNANERDETIASFREGKLDVLINFGVLTTGFDAPHIDTVIIARPTTSKVLYTQMVGRGLRGEAMGGTPSCLIVDVADSIQNLDPANFFTTFENNWKL